jgi:hypothetical protein
MLELLQKSLNRSHCPNEGPLGKKHNDVNREFVLGIDQIAIYLIPGVFNVQYLLAKINPIKNILKTP